VVELAKKHKARVLLDDAHSTGVLGKNGRGTCEHFGLSHDAVDLIVGTCSKAFASVGGFVVGSEEAVHFLQINSRSMIFSAALPPAPTAAISKALDIIQEEPWRRAQLHKNADRLRSGLASLGFNIGPTETPIVPIIVGEDMDAFRFWRTTFDAGIFTNPVISPAVPPGRALIRVTVMATHTFDQVDRALNIFEHCGRKAGLIRGSRPRPRPRGELVGA
jgi:8-amino-7-oxononanoate synthase